MGNGWASLIQPRTSIPNLLSGSDKFKSVPVENGRVFIGTTGGFDAGGIQRTTIHVRIELFRGNKVPPLIDGAGEKQQTKRNAARIPWREAFCK